METLKKWLSAYPRAKVLDVATGSGAFFGLLLEAEASLDDSVGIDCSERAVAAARGQFAEFPKLHFETMDGATMSFRDASWDVVSLANSLHHLPNRTKVLREMERVLRPGGILILQEMVADGLTHSQLSHRKFHHLSAEIDRKMGIHHRPTYPRDAIRSWVRQHSTLEYAEEWILALAEAEEPNQDETDALFSLMDRVVNRIVDSQTRAPFAAKAARIRAYIEINGWDACPEMMIVLKKSIPAPR